jgi:hypothetical protein
VGVPKVCFASNLEASAMNLLTAMIILALLATIGALAAGVISMVRGGEYDEKHEVSLMFTRVGFQGVALVLLLVALFVANF